MAAHVYRYEMSGAFEAYLRGLVGGSPVVIGGISPGTFLDITADDTQLDDLTTAMDQIGYVYISTDPTTTPQTQALATLVQRATAVVDFGTGIEGNVATTAVAAAWVTADSALVVTVRGYSPDHPADQDDVGVEGMSAVAANIVPGVGFDVTAACPNGTWGKWNVEILGL